MFTEFGQHITDISTHILTRRMTASAVQKNPVEEISTHILTRRMTLTEYISEGLIDISTHILTRRMTADTLPDDLMTIFQLTSSQGG